MGGDRSPGSAAIAGSSSDSAATYQRAHAAAAGAPVDTAPQDRVNMVYEKQMAWALQVPTYTWFEDKKKRVRRRRRRIL